MSIDVSKKLEILICLGLLCMCCAYRRNASEGTLAESMSDSTVSSKVDTLAFPVEPNSIYTLNHDFDLQGRTYKFPAGVTIKQNVGCFKNGVLIGDKTKIFARNDLFDCVSIAGSWAVSDISTDLFKNLDYTNSLVDVIALSNPNISNNIHVKKGRYYLRVNKENQSGLILQSNTNLVLDGELYLEANSFKHYNVICVRGINVQISGSGSIIGDRNNHTGSDGEWGMGLRFSNARNSSVSNVTIKNCWGDCIYVGNNSTNINIRECKLRNGRRQGISVTSGKNIIIDKCEIYDVNGTDPMYAIDIEPNKKNKVDSVIIRNVETHNCKGGILCTRSTISDSYIGYVEVENCSVNETFEKNSYEFKGANTIVLKNCKGTGNKIKFIHVDNVVVAHNSISKKDSNDLYDYHKCKKISQK